MRITLKLGKNTLREVIETEKGRVTSHHGLTPGDEYQYISAQKPLPDDATRKTVGFGLINSKADLQTLQLPSMTLDESEDMEVFLSSQNLELLASHYGDDEAMSALYALKLREGVDLSTVVILQKSEASCSVFFGSGLISIVENERDTKLTTYKVSASVSGHAWMSEITYDQFLQVSRILDQDQYSLSVDTSGLPIIGTPA